MYAISQRFSLWVPVLLMAFGGASGCSTTEVSQDDPVALMKEAEEDIEASRYILAGDNLRAIRNKHPYSKQAVDAALRLADVFFLQESFVEAAASYEAFADLHPKHEKISYARYRVALSYFNDIPSVHARDLTSAQKAQDAFNEYMVTFPNEPLAAEAKTKLAETRAILAEKEMYVGNFYYKRKYWDAAKSRYEKVINLYPDTPYVGEAQEKVAAVASMPKAPEPETRGGK